MAGDNNGAQNPIEATPPPKAVITITLNANGSCSVSFPNDEPTCRFLLDKGTDAIKDELRRRSMPLVTEAGGTTPPRPNFGRRILRG